MCPRFVLAAVLAISLSACAKRDPAIQSLTDSEPQRLLFGPPAQVIPGFVDKMKMCWFAGANPVLRGYRFETGDRPGDSGDSDHPAADGYKNIKIYNAEGGAEMFEVQFHQYNENTLIVTRNVSVPAELLTKLKRDIQVWGMSSADCGTI